MEGFSDIARVMFYLVSVVALSFAGGRSIHKFVLRFEKTKIWLKGFYRKFKSLKEEVARLDEQAKQDHETISELQSELRIWKENASWDLRARTQFSRRRTLTATGQHEKADSSEAKLAGKFVGDLSTPSHKCQYCPLFKLYKNIPLGDVLTRISEINSEMGDDPVQPTRSGSSLSSILDKT